MILAPIAAAALAGAAAAGVEPPRTLRVLTYNVWHGLRREGVARLAGEEDERRERRFALQLEQLRRLAPDVILLQEVNPAPRRAQRYAEALGYDEVHRVANCGVHLGPIRIPTNVNEGLAILARPSLALRRLGARRLSGCGACGDAIGMQVGETRYALFGEVTLAGGRRVGLANAHLHGAPFVGPGFAQDLQALVERGTLTAAERDEVLRPIAEGTAPTEREIRRLLESLGRRRARAERDGAAWPVILAGDFNAIPDSRVVELVERAGFRDAVPADARATYDPRRNAANFDIASTPALRPPTFGRPEVGALLDAAGRMPRRIDYVCAGAGLEVLSSRVVLDEESKGLIGSDHFGVLVELRLAAHAASAP